MKYCQPSICDTMWVARNQTKGLDMRSPTRPEVGEERQVREKPERAVGKGTQRGQLAKGTQ